MYISLKNISVISPPRLLFLSRTSDWTNQSIRNRSEKQRRCSKETKRKQKENSRAPNKYEMWHALQENQECYDYVNVKTSTFASKSIYPRRKTSNPYSSGFLYTICSFGVYSRHHTWSQFAISLGWTPYFALAPLMYSRNFLVASSFDISCSNGDSLLTPPNVEHAIETKLLCCNVRTWHVLNLVRLPYQKDIQVATRPVRRAASFEISKDTFETDRLSCCQGAVFYVIRFVWFDAYTTHCHRERSSYLSMTSGFACLYRPMPHFFKNDDKHHAKALSGDRVVCAHVRLPGVCKS